MVPGITILSVGIAQITAYNVESEEMGEVNIETLTMEQYLALDRSDTTNENEDAHEHVGRILEIASLFNTPGVSGDAVMLQENVHAIKGRYESCNEIYYGDHCLSSEDVKCVKAMEYREDSLMVTLGNNSPSGNMPKLEETHGKYLEDSCKRKDIFDEWMKRFRENTNKNLKRHDFAIKGLEENVARLAQAIFTHNKLNQDRTLDMKRNTIISPISVNSNLVHCMNSIGQEIIKKLEEKEGSPQETPTKELGTFNVSGFIEKGLIEVLLGKSFKECVGLEEGVTEGILLFKIGNDKTIFNMLQAFSKFSKLTATRRNMMAPILRISEEDKARGIHHPYQKIKELYKGCLHLGIEYKRDEEAIDWIIRGHARFPAQSVGSSNTDVLDSPCLLVLVTETSQSRQHVIFDIEVLGTGNVDCDAREWLWMTLISQYIVLLLGWQWTTYHLLEFVCHQWLYVNRDSPLDLNSKEAVSSKWLSLLGTLRVTMLMVFKSSSYHALELVRIHLAGLCTLLPSEILSIFDDVAQRTKNVKELNRRFLAIDDVVSPEEQKNFSGA
ncbi:hypothetical protein Tco_0389879 [Tanacetum coccineum]